jgi:AraC family transcriptional regulator
MLLERHTVGAIEIPEHEHRDLCLHLQLAGQPDLEWWSEGSNRVEQTAPGSMILLHPGTRDRLRWQDTSDRLLISLRPEWLTAVAATHNAPAPDFRNRWALRDPALANLLQSMHTYAAEGFPLGSLYTDLLEQNLAHLLLHRFAATPITLPTRHAGLPEPKLRRALEYITDNLHRDLRLEDIAQQTGLSPFHFTRQFRSTLGQTPHQYLLDQRIARAKTLLRHTTLPVQEIAPQTGFSSPTNFVRAFRQRVGIAPASWRSGNS